MIIQSLVSVTMGSDKSTYNIMFNFVLLCLFSFICANESVTDNSQGCQTPDNTPGICISIADCAFNIDILRKKPLTTETKEKLRGYACGFDDRTPKVCCPHKNINLINQKYCGMTNYDDKLLGGNGTEPEQYPWSALISYNTASGQQFLCGGSLINENYVLTSAHCIHDLPLQHELMTVRLGEHDTSKEPDCFFYDPEDCVSSVQDMKVSEIIPHPNYNPMTLDNNIGLLRFSKPINFTDSVRPICLSEKKEFTETRLLVSGWGANNFAHQSTKLLKYINTVVPIEECQRNYSKIAPQITIGNNQICVKEIEIESHPCIGERGDPLYQYSKNRETKDYVILQFGIMSYGSKLCTNVNQPKVHTKVAPYINWILDNIKS